MTSIQQQRENILDQVVSVTTNAHILLEGVANHNVDECYFTQIGIDLQKVSLIMDKLVQFVNK